MRTKNELIDLLIVKSKVLLKTRESKGLCSCIKKLHRLGDIDLREYRLLMNLIDRRWTDFIESNYFPYYFMPYDYINRKNWLETLKKKQ